MINKIKNNIQYQIKNKIIYACFNDLIKHNYKLGLIAGKRFVTEKLFMI